MKQHLITGTMLALSLLLTVSSCDKEDDSKPIDSNTPENTDTPEDPIVEMVTITFSDNTKQELEKGTVYTLPAGEKEYIIYKIGDEKFGSGDKVIINKNLEISIVAKYQELTFAELKTADFTGKDEVSLMITDANDENIGAIDDHLTAKTNLILAGSITNIADWAFHGSKFLNSIVIPNSVTRIGDAAFGSSVLESIDIPNSVTSIGVGAFTYCKSLKSIVIPNSVTSIGKSAFNISSLESISIPNSITSLEEELFRDCKSLKSVSIPNSVKSIGKEVFSNCQSLESIEIPSSVTSIENGTFAYCKSLKTITIPNSVTSIGKQAFTSCESLESIEIPNSVTSIGESSFFLCSALESITINNTETNVTIGEMAFDGCPGNPVFQPESN